MRFQTTSEEFGSITYTISSHEFAMSDQVLRNVDEAWREDGTRLDYKEVFRLQAELEARNAL